MVIANSNMNSNMNSNSNSNMNNSNDSKRRMDIATRRTMLLLAIVLIFSAHQIFYNGFLEPGFIKYDQSFQNILQRPADANSVTLSTNANTNTNTNTGKCLDLDLDQDMDRLLSKYKQVYVIMPAKAAGTSLKDFTKQCMRASKTFTFAKTDNILMRQDGSQYLENAFSNQLKLPSLITSHLTVSERVCRIVQHATKDSLIVYSHREETSRLVSGIKEVVRNNRRKMCEKNDNGDCLLAETKLLKLIRDESNLNEIRIGGTQLLTCATYRCIRENRPNFVYLHYQQAGRLQKLLAKHHCPALQNHTEVQANVGADKQAVLVVLKNSQRQVELDDWLAAKRPLLEYFFRLRMDASCIGTTRDLEEDLLACPHETMQISGRSADGHKVSFPYPFEN